MNIVKLNKNNNTEKYNIASEFHTKSDLTFDESLSVAKRAQASMTVDALVKDGKKESLDLSTVQQLFGVKQNFAKAITPSNYKTNSTTVSSSTSKTSSTGQVSPRTLNQSTAETLATATGKSVAYGTLTVPDEYKAIFEEAAEKYGVDEKFIESVAMTESAFNTNITSSAGAQGVMQLMPSVQEYYGVTDPYDAYQNIMAGTHLLADLLERYNGNYALAAAGYNAGAGSVATYDGIPPYEETQNYVVTVLDYYQNR